MTKIIFTDDGYHLISEIYFIPLAYLNIYAMNRTNFYLSRNDTIAEIQSSFSQFYPSLEIKFFSNNEKTPSNDAWVKLSPEVKIRDISPDGRDGCIEINDRITLADMENSMNDHFKLHVEISPLMGKRDFSLHQSRFRPQISKNAGSVRLPERTNTTCFKNVPFGC
jgi:hypothetical protein